MKYRTNATVVSIAIGRYIMGPQPLEARQNVAVPCYVLESVGDVGVRSVGVCETIQRLGLEGQEPGVHPDPFPRGEGLEDAAQGLEEATGDGPIHYAVIVG